MRRRTGSPLPAVFLSGLGCRGVACMPEEVATRTVRYSGNRPKHETAVAVLLVLNRCPQPRSTWTSSRPSSTSRRSRLCLRGKTSASCTTPCTVCRARTLRCLACSRFFVCHLSLFCFSCCDFTYLIGECEGVDKVGTVLGSGSFGISRSRVLCLCFSMKAICRYGIYS